MFNFLTISSFSNFYNDSKTFKSMNNNNLLNKKKQRNILIIDILNETKLYNNNIKKK